MSRTRLSFVCSLLLVLVLTVAGFARAANNDPWSSADQVRRALFDAQSALLNHDSAAATAAVAQAHGLYVDSLRESISASAADLAPVLDNAFADAATAAAASDASGLASARSSVWVDLLHAATRISLDAIHKGDSATANAWLLLREYRTPTKFSRSGADATLAMKQFAAGKISAADAETAVRNDLLDTYQAKLNESLNDADKAAKQTFVAKQVEQSALAAGYFDLLTDPVLSSAYTALHGKDSLTSAQATFSSLVKTASSSDANAFTTARADVDTTLTGFRAAPLSDEELARRAGQMLRFIDLVPVEYGRGVSNGVVMKDIEMQEALTFHAGAAAAFADLQGTLSARDAAATAEVSKLLTTTVDQIHQVVDPSALQATVDQIKGKLDGLLPAEWKSVNNDSDVDVITSILDQVEAAAVQGQYALAESSRLEAYAMLELGIEQRLRGFAPDKANDIEGMFWQGTSEAPGLSALIGAEAPASAIKLEIANLKTALTDAMIFLNSAKSAPEVVAGNAGIVVFREGLEAVLILASLLASLRGIEERKFRRPIVMGAGLAFLATGVTWWLANQVLMSMMQLGERLEAVTSLIAIVVLLMVTNWFFHKVYWTGWMANFHSRKKQIVTGVVTVAIGQSLGLIILGFTSVFREGVETVVFLQSMVLEAGTSVVLNGVLIGLVGVAIVGVITFALQVKLPYKKMLIVTGVLIGFVLLTMVGNTVHVLQSVGWMPITPITGLYIPFWMGQWFGLFATWQGIVLQFAAAAFVIGSYFWAERINHRKRDTATTKRVTQSSQVAPINH